MSDYRYYPEDIPAGVEGELVRLLAGHAGHAQAIGREDLLAQLRLYGHQISERTMRQAIHELRRKGYLICGMPGTDGGYYMAATLQEFDEFIERELHPKAMDLLETEKAMKAAARQRFGEAAQVGLF
jgi:hypothetical protein